MIQENFIKKIDSDEKAILFKEEILKTLNMLADPNKHEQLNTKQIEITKSQNLTYKSIQKMFIISFNEIDALYEKYKDTLFKDTIKLNKKIRVEESEFCLYEKEIIPEEIEAENIDEEDTEYEY